jgi:hypothetical protein
MELLAYTGQFIVSHAPELVGVLMPPIIDILSKDVKKENERFIVTLLITFGAALLLKWDTLSYGNPDQLITSFGIIFAESQVVFKLYFKDSWAREKMFQFLIASPAQAQEEQSPVIDVNKLP